MGSISFLASHRAEYRNSGPSTVRCMLVSKVFDSSEKLSQVYACKLNFSSPGKCVPTGLPCKAACTETLHFFAAGIFKKQLAVVLLSDPVRPLDFLGFVSSRSPQHCLSLLPRDIKFGGWNWCISTKDAKCLHRCLIHCWVLPRQNVLLQTLPLSFDTQNLIKFLN